MYIAPNPVDSPQTAHDIEQARIMEMPVIKGVALSIPDDRSIRPVLVSVIHAKDM